MKNNLLGKNPKLVAKHLKMRPLLAVGFVLLLVGGGFYVYNTYAYHKQEAMSNAIYTVDSAKAFIAPKDIETLTVSAEDLQKPQYQKLKQGLMEFKRLKPDIAFAYIYTQKSGKVYFIADSEVPGSAGYSAPGQEYAAAEEITKKPFLDKQSLVTSPFTDSWGTWVTAVAPIINGEGNAIAVLAADYPYSNWKAEIMGNTLSALFMVVSILLFIMALLWAYEKKNALAETSKKLQYSEELFRTVFEQAPIGIAIMGYDKVMCNVNPMFAKILGRSREELEALEWTQITHADDIAEDLRQFEAFKAGKINGYSMDKRYLKPQGSLVWVNMTLAPLSVRNEENSQYLCLIKDITQSKITEQALQESERSKSVLLANLPGMAYRCKNDRYWTMLFVSEGCLELTGYKPSSLLHNSEVAFNDLIPLEYQALIEQEWLRVIALRSRFRYEYEIISATGERKWVLELAQPVYDEQGNVEALEGIIIDISEQKRRELQIKYLNERDFLTGLYNRRFIDQAKEQFNQEEFLPLSLIVGDINGVKMVNDAFGYAEGDDMIKNAARIIQKHCREKDLLGRTGGDEFILLLPNTDKDTALMLLQNIKQACKKHNEQYGNKYYHINIAFGCATKETLSQPMRDIEKEAEDLMFTRKLLNRKSSHNAILASIMATMYARSHETEEHAKRLAVISKNIGKRLGLTQKQLDELELFAMLHDIGKIGIDDRILNKRGKLNDFEREEMKKHAEIGYRIAKSSSELEPISEYIFSHHEHWDGKGYPRGLQGEQIPILSRILAVADAYDAMTEDRVYRKGLSKQTAIEEIKKNSGTQFDPNIVAVFIQFLDEKNL